MEQIRFATREDIPAVLDLMNNAVSTTTPKDWYVTDDEDFVSRHISSEGYTLLYITDNQPAAFLIVRHPGEAEDNLGRYLWDGGAAGVQASNAGMPLGQPHLPEILRYIAHMESAAVHPAHRGKGLQGKLLQRAEEMERDHATRFLMATVHPENVYSLRNLEAAGYQCILETEKYGGLRRKVMCKEL